MNHLRRLLLLAIGLAFTLTGCSSFNRDWKKAGAGAANTPAISSLAGRWEGRWESGKNGHNGPLRCLITSQTNDVYSARYHAKYRRLITIRFGYTAMLQTQPGPHPFNFSGSADLGWLAGGIYRYEGHASATNFVSTYTSKYDHGTFRMERVGASFTPAFLPSVTPDSAITNNQ